MRRRVIFMAAALAVLAGAVVAPSQAGASAPVYNLIKTSYFTESPKAGAITCQHRYVTLPKLSSNNRYEWDEDFPQETSEALSNYHQTFYGKFYWSVCVSSMKGKSAHWTYVEYSLLTGVNSACENQGHCFTLYLQNHYLYVTSGHYEWGSQLTVKPASWCSYEACQSQGGVTVKKT